MSPAEVRVEPVQTAGQLRAFINLPWLIYRGDPIWVPPLKGDVKKLLSPSHPFFEHARVDLFLALGQGRPIGRVAAIHDQNYIDFGQEEVVFFGFYECIDDPAVARALFDRVKAWAGERGFKVVRGPMNPSTNESCGFLSRGFDDPPSLMMPYNPPYYLDQAEDNGFKVCKELPAFLVPITDKLEFLAEPAARCREALPGLTLRPIRANRIVEDLEKIREVYNEAWARNWGFAPTTLSEMRHQAKELKQILVPDLVKIAEIDGQPVAIYVALPDYNQALSHINGRLDPISILKLLYYRRKITRVRTMLLGVKRAYHRQGLTTLLMDDHYRSAMKLGYQWVEGSWILEDNAPMTRALERVGGQAYKTYRIYEGEVA